MSWRKNAALAEIDELGDKLSPARAEALLDEFEHDVVAPRYWGLSASEYTEAADLWPLDPRGEMFFMPLIEGVEGVLNPEPKIILVDSTI
jgi:hypothetical protein